MYADEIVPGNIVAYRQSRKMWCIYWTFLEFGPSALSNEDHMSYTVHTSYNSHDHVRCSAFVSQRGCGCDRWKKTLKQNKKNKNETQTKTERKGHLKSVVNHYMNTSV